MQGAFAPQREEILEVRMMLPTDIQGLEWPAACAHCCYQASAIGCCWQNITA